MKIKILLSIFLFIILNAECALYDISFDRIESIPGEGGVIVFDARTVRVKKFNRTTYVMNGNGSLYRPLDRDTIINLTVFFFEAGEYKIFLSKTFGFCEFKNLPGHKEILEDFEAHTNNPVPSDACPYPAMDKQITNYALKEERFNFIPPGLPGEKWRINFLFNENGVDLGGFNVYVILKTHNIFAKKES
ncbi:CLUMA_CG016179, isoform A [Clunio marinus]|uniref:CLUMA_CG016179, isoform A n=1 Tax=Clunio marinus TaxID=568069 RepID=A0A1J1ITK7_9DIPT|nr:CLUMA_CG016179, isoform A [Clunio marinus]